MVKLKKELRNTLLTAMGMMAGFGAVSAAKADPTVIGIQGSTATANTSSASNAASAASAKADGSSHVNMPVIVPTASRQVVGQTDKYCIVKQDFKTKYNPATKKREKVAKGEPYWTASTLSVGGDPALAAGGHGFGLSIPTPWGGHKLNVSDTRLDKEHGEAMCGGPAYHVEQPAPIVAAAPTPVAAPAPLVAAAPAPIVLKIPTGEKKIVKKEEKKVVVAPKTASTPKKAASAPKVEKHCFEVPAINGADTNGDKITAIVNDGKGGYTLADNTPTTAQVADITAKAEAQFKDNAAKAAAKAKAADAAAFKAADQNHNGKVFTDANGKYTDDSFMNILGKNLLGIGLIAAVAALGGALVRGLFKPKKAKPTAAPRVAPTVLGAEPAKPAAPAAAATTATVQPATEPTAPAADKDKGATPSALGAAAVGAVLAMGATSPNYQVKPVSVRYTTPTTAVSAQAPDAVETPAKSEGHGYDIGNRRSGAGYTPHFAEAPKAVEPTPARPGERVLVGEKTGESKTTYRFQAPTAG